VLPHFDGGRRRRRREGGRLARAAIHQDVTNSPFSVIRAHFVQALGGVSPREEISSLALTAPSFSRIRALLFDVTSCTSFPLIIAIIAAAAAADTVPLEQFGWTLRHRYPSRIVDVTTRRTRPQHVSGYSGKTRVRVPCFAESRPP